MLVRFISLFRFGIFQQENVSSAILSLQPRRKITKTGQNPPSTSGPSCAMTGDPQRGSLPPPRHTRPAAPGPPPRGAAGTEHFSLGVLQVLTWSCSTQGSMICCDFAQGINALAVLSTRSTAAAHATAGGEASVASQGRKGNCNWGTGCHQACSGLPGDALDHASLICCETNTWERDAVSWDTRDGDAGAARGSAHTGELVVLNPVKATPASCIAGFENGSTGERERGCRKGCAEGVEKGVRLFGVQVSLPDA